MRLAVLSNVEALAPAPVRPALGAIKLLSENGGPAIVLPFGGGNAHEALLAALAHWPDPDSSIDGGYVLDNDRQLLALAVRRNPAANTAPDHPPSTSSRTMWLDGAPDRRNPQS